MKKGLFFLCGLILLACQETESVNEVTDFTGNETTYLLQQASDYAVNGTILFKEKKDGTTIANVQLNGTDGTLKYPVHLHLGNIATPNAEVALLLSPVNADNGKSETIITHLADDSSVTYQQLIGMEACIKIHLAESGPDRDVILAGGNIGKSSLKEATSGRIGFSVCKSE
ncbi:MAG: hypothetical protein DI538_29505 [Azospira oryzae]|jgi:hypothetical protein|nr:MAG: hypothetical protein DI538_29505 [Azospira oryzae]